MCVCVLGVHSHFPPGSGRLANPCIASAMFLIMCGRRHCVCYGVFGLACAMWPRAGWPLERRPWLRLVCGLLGASPDRQGFPPMAIDAISRALAVRGLTGRGVAASAFRARVRSIGPRSSRAGDVAAAWLIVRMLRCSCGVENSLTASSCPRSSQPKHRRPADSQDMLVEKRFEAMVLLGARALRAKDVAAQV